MPPTTSLLAFLTTSLALLLVPGPSVLFVISRGVALGRRAAITTVIGNESGTLVHAVAVALGAGAVVQQSAAVFNVLKLAGAAYLVYLGVSAVRHRRGFAELVAGPSRTTSTTRLWRDGLVVGISNPKTSLFFLAILPQFADPGRGHMTLQLLVLGVLFCLLAAVTDGLYGVTAGSLRRWLDGRPRRAEAIGVTSGVMMIGLGVRLAFTGRHD